MASINTGKVVVGGIAAGVVINVVETVMNLFVLATAMEEQLTALGLEALGGGAMGGFMALAFTLGILMAWTYASIRPRYGPGAGTAMKAGFAVWLAFYFLGHGTQVLMGMSELNIFLIAMAYSLPMCLAAAYLAGMLYKEEG